MAIFSNIFKCFMPDNSAKIGLCQFREQETPVTKKSKPINDKNIKLSDLMRRVS